MSLELIPDTQTTDSTDGGEGLTHLVCACNEHRALCGTDLTDGVEVGDWGEVELVECVVCEDLCDQPCERCGR